MELAGLSEVRSEGEAPALPASRRGEEAAHRRVPRPHDGHRSRLTDTAETAVPVSVYTDTGAELARWAEPLPEVAPPVAPVAPTEALDLDIEPRRRSELLNRAVNVALAAVALVVLAPVMLAVALLVKLTSRGPILYMQTRVGLDRRRRGADALFDRREGDFGGRVFNIYKFRSMRADAERATGAVWATRNDPRVTPVGRALRQLRLDELPQLVNVLKGDMNIVGPRPERPSIFARLRNDIREYPLRQRAKPGVTGWAQVNQSYDATIEDVRSKVRYDLEYLRRQSLAEDLKIMLRTIPVMVFKRGAQ